MPPVSRPIFFDPKGRRSWATNLVLIVLALATISGIVVVAFGLLVSPPLPDLTGPPERRQSAKSAFGRMLGGYSESHISSLRSRQLPVSATQTMRLAYLSAEEVDGIASLKRNSSELDGIIPNWLTIAKAGGAVDLHVNPAAQQVVEWIRRHAPHVGIYPQLTSQLTNGEAAAVLASSTTRSRMVEKLVSYLRQNDFRGITVHLPNLPDASHRALAMLIRDLREQLTSEERRVIVTVSTHSPNGNLQDLARAADYLLLQLHDQTDNRPGPVASQGWFESELWTKAQRLGPGKLIVTIGAFAYDWDSRGIKQQLSVQAVWERAKASEASIRFDGHTLSPSFNYVDGKNSVRYPEILQRIYDEGHDIGSHSFSHPNMFESGPGRIRFELNATQRVFEYQLGINSTLFRAPYVWDRFDYLVSSPQLIETASSLGYFIGGVEVDGLDWLPGITSDQIVERVVSQVLEGRGQTILLHDAGLDREATIKALPIIIDELQSRGYRFVATHELIGKARDELMPRPQAQDFIASAADSIRLASTRIVTWSGSFIPVLGITTAILGGMRLTLIIVGAYVQKRRRQRETAGAWRPPTVAVLVPAYNEETVICKTIDTLLASSMGDRIEIVVIDDESSDRTSEVVTEAYAGIDRVKVLGKPNGGKAAALKVASRGVV